jgi:hypothetical protein
VREARTSVCVGGLERSRQFAHCDIVPRPERRACHSATEVSDTGHRMPWRTGKQCLTLKPTVADAYAQAACTSSSDPLACSNDTITLTGLTPPMLAAVGATMKPWGGVGDSGTTTVG